MNLPSSLCLSFVVWLAASGQRSVFAQATNAANAQAASTAASSEEFALQARERERCEAILIEHPEDVHAQSDDVQASERMALLRRGGGDRDQALEILLRAQRFAPENARLLYDLGILEEEMQLYRDADRSVSRAIELGGTDPYLLYAAARVKLDLGQLGAAEEKMQAYLKLRPEDASAHYALGRIYHQGMRFDEARAEFLRSIELQPKQTESYFQLGEIDLQRGAYEAAVTNYAVTLKGDPKHVGALVGTGIAEFRLKQYAKALAPLHEAVALEPGYQPGHYYLGLVLARVGQRDESTTELAEATRLADAENKKSIQQLHLLNPSEAVKPE